MAGRPAEGKLFMETLLDELERRQRVARGSTLSRISLLASDSSFARSSSSVADSEESFQAAASSLLEKAAPGQQGGSWYEAGSTRDDCESVVSSCDATSALRASKPPTHQRRNSSHSLPHPSPTSTLSAMNWGEGAPTHQRRKSFQSLPHPDPTPTLSAMNWRDNPLSSGSHSLGSSATPPLSVVTGDVDSGGSEREVSSAGQSSRTGSNSVGAETFQLSPEGMAASKRTSFDPASTASITSPELPTGSRTSEAAATGSRPRDVAAPAGSSIFEAVAADTSLSQAAAAASGSKTREEPVARTSKQAAATGSRASREPVDTGSRSPWEVAATSSRTLEEAPATTGSRSPWEAAATSSRTPEEAPATSGRSSEGAEPSRKEPERAPPAGYPNWIDLGPESAMGEMSMIFHDARHKYRNGSLEAFPAFATSVRTATEVESTEAAPPRNLLRQRVTFVKGVKEDSVRERKADKAKKAASKKQTPACCVIL